jgi:hypothetical protein
MELALPLLPLIAPDVAPPIAYRAGDEPPRFVGVEADRLVAPAVREAGREALREGDRASSLRPRSSTEIEPLCLTLRRRSTRCRPDPGADTAGAKGSSSTASCWSSPPDRAGGVEGLRALYVALTRATKTLVVVHAEPLPAELDT